MSEEAAPPKRPRGRPRKNPLPQVEAVKNEDLPPSVVTFKGPESQDKFEWGEEIKTEEEKAKKPSAGSLPLSAADLASQLTGAVAGVYSLLITATGWSGWAMSEEERKAWEAVLLPLLKSIDPAKWGLALALVALLLLTGGKVAMFLSWKRKSAPVKVVKEAGAAPRPAATPPDAIPVGAPMEYAE